MIIYHNKGRVIKMKRILVFSDTHGKTEFCKKIIDNIPCDAVIHAGDINRDISDLISSYPDIPIWGVQGNNDFSALYPNSRIEELDGVKIFITHGHGYKVKYESDYRTLAREAKLKGCSVAVFGHTHMAYEGTTYGVKLLNPGSTRFNENYGVIEIDNGEAKICTI